MKELFDGRLAPITYVMGFLECPVATAVEAYIAWESAVQAARHVSVTAMPVKGGLEDVLLTLLPLTSVERRRFLFIPTSSPWTAFFDNGNKSTDAFAPMSYLAKVIGCKAMRVTWVPEGARGRHPARIWEIYGPRRTGWLNIIRAVEVVADGKNWEFRESGEVQPYEQLHNYYKDPVSERFTPRMLELYLQRNGLRPYEEDFFLPDQAVLIEKHGPIAPNAKEFGLSGGA